MLGKIALCNTSRRGSGSGSLAPSSGPDRLHNDDQKPRFTALAFVVLHVMLYSLFEARYFQRAFLVRKQGTFLRWSSGHADRRLSRSLLDFDTVVKSESPWKLRKVIRIINRVLNALRVDKQPGKTFTGSVEKGFDLLDYHLKPTPQTIDRQCIDHQCIDRQCIDHQCINCHGIDHHPADADQSATD